MALVTGAGKRLGRAVALHLASEGAQVAVHFNRSKGEAEEVVAEIENMGSKAAALQADLNKVEEIRRLFADAHARFGRLDILVNSAANFLQTEFAKTSEKEWDGSLDTNLKAPFFCTQAAAPELKKTRGVVINFSDVGGILGWTGYIPHCVSKAGIIMLTRVLAKELAPEVRVNAIAPGTITMPGDPAEWEEDYVKRAPLQMSGKPADVTQAVSFLVQAEMMTGHVLVLDAGRSL